MDELKAKTTDAFDNFDELKTPACLDAKTVGLFAEYKLTDKEMANAESHIQSCLYCLGRLTELKELLHLASEAGPVSPELEKRLSGLSAQHRKSARETNDKG